MRKKLVLVYILLFALCTNGYSEVMSVAFTGMEMRSAPNAMASKLITNIPIYTPLEIIEKGAEYYKIKDYRGRTGWVHRSLLSSKSSIVVTGNLANIRQGPGTSYSVAFQLSKGDACRVIANEGKWIEVQTNDGRRGWIAEFLTWGQ